MLDGRVHEFDEEIDDHAYLIWVPADMLFFSDDDRFFLQLGVDANEDSDMDEE